MSRVQRIAILGANSQIALDYIEHSLSRTKNHFFLFSRNSKQLELEVGHDVNARYECLEYSDFGRDNYDLIINCIGGSDPVLIARMEKDILSITNHYDELAIDYLKKNDQCKYIFISSGAAYGDIFTKEPASEITNASIFNEVLSKNDYYGAAKFFAEKRHRKLNKLNIIDLRLFGYISKRQNLDSKLFLSELMNCAKKGKTFYTSSDNFFRDYITDEDMFLVLQEIENIDGLNQSMDLYSGGKIDKLSILETFINKYQLNIEIVENLKINKKIYYYSIKKNILQHKLTRNSIENIEHVYKYYFY